MAEKETTPTVKKKIAKGKTWFKIHAPKIFNEKEIGETLGFEEASIKGRLISAPLSEITGDVTRHYVKLGLKVTDVKEGHAYTEIVDYSISRQYLSRLLRRHISKIETVSDIKFKDGKIFRVKTIAITAYKANARQRGAIFHAVKKEIEKQAVQYDLPGFVSALITGKIQKDAAKNIKKLFPIRLLEVRKIEVLPLKKEKKKKEEILTIEEEPAEKPKEEEQEEPEEEAAEEIGDAAEAQQ
jgi:small subunit ribosomal protein S3Ae